MPKIKKLGDRICFECPGCHELHRITDAWTFNGDLERPTFSPSVLMQSGHYIPGHEGACWCTYNAEHPNKPAPFTCVRCHSFVKDGKIQFLNDCTHGLAGQTVELPEVE